MRLPTPILAAGIGAVMLAHANRLLKKAGLADGPMP